MQGLERAETAEDMHIWY